jgi:hypothetical protein
MNTIQLGKMISDSFSSLETNISNECCFVIEVFDNKLWKIKLRFIYSNVSNQWRDSDLSDVNHNFKNLIRKLAAVFMFTEVLPDFLYFEMTCQQAKLIKIW